MSYQTALEAAGAKVKIFREFGDYQGTWLAFLEDGRVVEGAYGSCSGCDAFDAEFSYGSEDGCDDHRYNSVEICPDCISFRESYQAKLADFGASYLQSAATYKEKLAEYQNRFDSGNYFSEEQQQILTWLKSLTFSNAMTRVET